MTKEELEGLAILQALKGFRAASKTSLYLLEFPEEAEYIHLENEIWHYNKNVDQAGWMNRFNARGWETDSNA